MVGGKRLRVGATFLSYRNVRRSDAKRKRSLALDSWFGRRLAFESLEERALLSVAQDLQTQIQPYQSAINTALSVSTSLPLVGHQIESLQQVTTLLQNTLADLQQATQNLANGHHEIAIALTTISHSFTFDLGLDALLQVSTSGGVTGSITPTLNIAFDVSGTSATLDVAHTNLDLGFSLTLPGFQATMSLHHLLYTHAVDQGSNFSGHLLFGFNSGGGVSPQFSGDAHIRLGLSLSFADPALGVSFNPTFHTNFQLDWGLDTATNKLKIPQIALKNFSLDVDSFTHNFLGDIFTTVQKYTKPLQPFIDVFDTPVPILSAFDSSQTIGDLLLQGSGLSPEQQDRFELMVKVIKTVNAFDLMGSTGAMLDFGDINLTGTTLDANGNLLDTFGFDTSQLSGVIDDIFNSPLLDDLQGTLQSVASYAGVTSTAGFQFPVLEDPGPVIGAILTGQTRDMFTFTVGRQHFELAPSIGVGIEDVVGVFLSAGIIFDANFSAGYDTAGLVQFVQDPLHRPQDLLHGFYFDNSVDATAPPVPNVSSPKKTAFYLQGFAELKASAGVTLRGGLHANLNVELAAANTPHVYLDDLITNLNSPARIFVLSGQVYAEGAIELTLPNPVGPNITLFSYELAKDVLVDFNPPAQPVTETKPVIVIDVMNDHTLELDPAKIGAGGAVTVTAFHDYNVGAYLADGIRVEYPAEIVLYVERKNDFTSNYYNLIGMGGATPDGASISIIDPFRVFADEGAANPAPAQTTPAVVLAGGKNVNYRYTEAGDGSHAKVLLAGGLGSSTLTGGTIEFGNFIPAARLDQAKQHFGNTSGFDAAGVALINSSIDADVAPASVAGIIGSTMSASHGGLMLGGPGANSFIATGPGAYEMIGGAWVDTFNITPSFGGVAATYQIDGGGGDSDSLTVRVPADENVTFENAAVADKYHPAFKALAVQANAGLSATAHGIKKVQIVGTAGANVTLGDTSELDIEFAVRGGIVLTFGGTNAPDIFSVVTTGPYHGLANHFSAPFLGIGGPIDYETFTAPAVGPQLPDSVYFVTRTFGTNGRTQTIPFAVSDAKTSSIKLNGAGASDTYSINMGVGAFIDVAVTDTDVSTTNPLTVSTGDGSLLYNSMNFTDTTVDLDYYTGSFYYGGGLGYSYFTTSVHYTPTVTFSGNVVPTIQAAIPFQHTTIDRPLAFQAAQLSIGGPYTSTVVPVAGLQDTAISGIAWVVTTYPPTRIFRNLIATPPDLQILANAGTLTISSTTAYGPSINIQANLGTLSISKSAGWTGTVDDINILANAGVVNLDYATTFPSNQLVSITHRINILANTGTINSTDSATNYLLGGITSNTLSAQINIGTDASGAIQSLANVHGTINLHGENGWQALSIDDRGGSGAAPNWLLANTRTQIGDLAINYDVYGVLYRAYWRSGSPVTFRDSLPFSLIDLNGSTAYPYFPLDWNPGSLIQNSDGESVALNLSNYLGAHPPGATTYAATDLPPGLSLDPATGIISGTIPFNSYAGSPYATLLSATNGLYTREWTVEWDVANPIYVYIPYFEPTSSLPVNVDEAVYFRLDPISVTDYLGRTAVVTVTGLPPGLSFNPTNGIISGIIPAGSSPHGPYEVHVHADDGLETNDIVMPMLVSGIQLAAVPFVRLNHDGDAVDFNLNATTTSGGTLAYSAIDLPPGISLNTATGQITGTLPANASAVPRRYVSVTFDDGYTIKSIGLIWTVLQTGVNDTVAIQPIGPQSNQVGDFVNFSAQSSSTHSLPLQYFVTGAPIGMPFGFAPEFYFNGYNYGGFSGEIPLIAAQSSPYHVTITATNGINSASVSFDWQITGPQPPELPGDFDGTGTVDQGDYDIWRGSFGQNVTPYTSGDGNGDGHVDAADYTVWRDHLGQTTGGPGAGGASVVDEVPLRAETLAAPSVSAVESPLVPATVAPSLAILQASFTSFEAAPTLPLREIGSDAGRHALKSFSFAKMDLNLALAAYRNERIADSPDEPPPTLALATPVDAAIDSCFALLGADDTPTSARPSRLMRYDPRFAQYD